MKLLGAAGMTFNGLLGDGMPDWSCINRASIV